MEKPIRLLCFALAIGATAMLPVSSSAAILVDFEGLGLAQGTALTNQIPGLTFSDTLMALQGDPVIGFSGGGVSDRTPAGQTPFDAIGNSFITDIIPMGGTWMTDPGVPIVVQFMGLPVGDLSFKIADINGTTAQYEIMTAKVFSDLAGTDLLETETLSNGPAGDGRSDLVVFSSTGIKRLEIAVNRVNSNIVGFGVDNLRYQPIPEPSTLVIWSLLGALAITVGWWRRRRTA